jgi:N-acetylglucosamine-6-sulfatase
MDRGRQRHGVIRSFLCLGVIMCAMVPGAPAAVGRPTRPDIVLIVTDDQRIQTLSWMPTVWHEIVGKGKVFKRAMVPTSTCCPSRASLLTGLYAHDTKVWSNGLGWGRFVAAGMEDRTVAVWLRSAGYRTGLIGKYLNSYKGTVAPRGWSFWRAFQGVSGAYYDYQLRHGDGSVTVYGSDPSDYSTDVLRRLSLRYIHDTPSTKPFFLYLAPFAPHYPWTPAPRHRDLPAPVGRFDPPSLNEQNLSDKPPWIQRLPFVDESHIDRGRVGQYRSIRAVDDALRAIMELQHRRSRLGNTLFIIMSDNGEMWGEHRVKGKFVPYASATRVPLVIRWLGHVPQGVVDGRLALNLDVPATIAAVAKASHGPIDGLSLLSSLKRAGTVLEAGEAVRRGSNGTNVFRPAYCGWRTRRYLFVRYANGSSELYDYALDPYELRDRAPMATYRDVKKRLRSRAQANCQPPPPGFSW